MEHNKENRQIAFFYTQLPYLILYICFPFIAEIAIKTYQNIITAEYIYYAIFISSVQTIPFILFPKLNRWWSVIYFLIFYVPTFINLGHIYLFTNELDWLSIDTIVNSNFSEVKEFFIHFLNVKFAFFIIFLLGVSILLFIKIINIKIEIRITYKRLLLCIFSFMTTAAFIDNSSQHYPMVKKFAIAYYVHIKEKAFISRKINFGPIENLIKNQKNCTYVIVIGESATREHFSLYGYERQTNPQLEKIKNDLYIFDNITSATCHTTAVLKEVLSFDSLQGGDIISFFKAAGFKTFWLSNQFSYSEYGDIITIIGSQADVSYFISDRDTKFTDGKAWDELLLPHFNKALDDKNPKKVIFIHLYGSHIVYKDRYPKEFAIFEDRRSAVKQRICEYDNSILYTDYLLCKFISLLKQKNDHSYLLYFSDHGEDVSEAPDCIFCHSAAFAKPAMFTIPLFVWISDKYKEENIMFIRNWNKHKAYTTNKLIHSMIRLSRLDNHKIEDKFSLFTNS